MPSDRLRLMCRRYIRCYVCHKKWGILYIDRNLCRSYIFRRYKCAACKKYENDLISLDNFDDVVQVIVVESILS